MRGTEEENVLRSPGQMSNDGQWPGHFSLRAPCPARPSRVPELRRATGAGAGIGVDTAVRASARLRKDGIRDASPALLPAFPRPGGR